MADHDALSLADARRLVLTAQGFADRQTSGRAALARVFARTAIVQIDSVNAVVRSAYLPVFSRQGPYDRELLDRYAYGPRRALFEYWAHEASLIPLDDFPLFRWRMARAKRGVGTYGSIARVGREQSALVASVRERIAKDGPLSSSAFENARGSGSWWGWSDVKRALEYLFWAGELTTRTRRNFQRVYDLTERVIPAEFTAVQIAEADAIRELVRLSARALGVGTESDLRDYFRLDLADARRAIGELVEGGDLVPVNVENWRALAYRPAEVTPARRITRRALLSPFDSLIWERSRTERLFNFTFRLEIYTPAEKRVHGYYVLPYLHGERLAARVDLRSERAAGTLALHAVHYEPRVTDTVRAGLRDELERLANWLGLEHGVRIEGSARL